ncbi:DUF255 domain-containing protein [Engelhardtia mirabilis]|uniref:Thioredoxin domain-containing protein n=1 Tax=Engelhardtia mirabilis TaxID=2528011 RepID=A0A518BHH6_9BACT|nr:hypothetical protein Pla133_14530 [Planctomycetes bacterium Pla133]QDV00709.1 hypothetical protein Pla86_14520 [Planctomycetes bacterium Pla86]
MGRPGQHATLLARLATGIGLVLAPVACGAAATQETTAGEATAPQTDQGPRHTNALAGESSPYLLQHAHNPVDWHPWGAAAIELARAQDKPIFLSIGYSTCYWCHVMERETFEDEELAALINEYFVPIKVDREELPTVDDVYMTAVQLRTGSGGWPLSLFLDPESLDVFFGGTYFPPRGSEAQPGMETIVTVLGKRWAEGEAARVPLLEDARRLGNAVREVLSKPRPPAPLDGSIVDLAVNRVLARYDSINGGFGTAPKFPSEPELELLAEVAGEREDAARALERTLEAMAMGGIHDQLGGGFHRYSTDATWTVPHFEKMLYTQGQLAPLYATGAESFERPWFAGVAQGVLTYVAVELTGENGRYLSAQDAEVNAREGQSFLWSQEQMRAALDGFDPQVVVAVISDLGLTEGGNFVDPHHPAERGLSVLRLAVPPDAGETPLWKDAGFAAAMGRLLAVRRLRDQPATDDKTLAGWSGLMAAGAASAGASLRDSDAIASAAQALKLVDTSLRDGDGRLHRSWRAGRLGPLAVSEDHAFLLRGLLALHSATGDEAWLERAVEVYDEARTLYWDEIGGGWFDSAPGGHDLLPIRAKTVGDGATPAANSELLLAAVELARRTEQERFLEDATAAIRFLSTTLASNPPSMPRAVIAIRRLLQFAPERMPAPPSLPAARDSQVAFYLERTAADHSQLTLTLEITEGFHINAPDPGAIGLAGLELELSGAPDVELEATLPDGEPFTGPLDDVILLVLEGRIEIPLALRGDLGDPEQVRLSVSYQVCDDRQCYPPRRVDLRLP